MICIFWRQRVESRITSWLLQIGYAHCTEQARHASLLLLLQTLLLYLARSVRGISSTCCSPWPSPVVPRHCYPHRRPLAASAKVQWKRRGCQNDGLDLRLREPHLRFHDRAARARVRRGLQRHDSRLDGNIILGGDGTNGEGKRALTARREGAKMTISVFVLASRDRLA
jgi:hypothetical protein